ncbi:hypothetical protein CBOM_05655 [Ceraceosorus bombacis]|uniref:Uncharacterized protein n=1 Tax=Ceraceosorus bombacis TaxID=401625 RepID=A0A0P1BSQ4_9BASI|nr:hypothetical protein CBOM_05655 [Ceraceosorus bombacis]
MPSPASVALYWDRRCSESQVVNNALTLERMVVAYNLVDVERTLMSFVEETLNVLKTAAHVPPGGSRSGSSGS